MSLDNRTDNQQQTADRQPSEPLTLKGPKPMPISEEMQSDEAYEAQIEQENTDEPDTN